MVDPVYLTQIVLQRPAYLEFVVLAQSIKTMAAMVKYVEMIMIVLPKTATMELVLSVMAN